MSNALGTYIVTHFANAAVTALHKRFGMALRLFMGYDQERRVAKAGDTIDIKVPGTFTAQNAPNSTKQDFNTRNLELEVNRWKEVKVTLDDKEWWALQKDPDGVMPQLLKDHMPEIGSALARDVAQYLTGFYAQVPNVYDLNASPGSVITDVTGPRKILRALGVPLDDPSVLHYAIDEDMEANLLGLAQFSQNQGSGDVGVQTQISGNLNVRYGLQFFVDQMLQTHTAGTLSATDPLLKGAAVAGATSITLDKGTLTGTLKAGDTFVLAGHEQRYAVLANATAASNEIAITITPPLVQDYADNTQATVRLESGNELLLFHRNFAALAFGRLVEDTSLSELGIAVKEVFDPETRISLRTRIAYDDDLSARVLTTDVLYGGVVLDGNRAVRCNY